MAYTSQYPTHDTGHVKTTTTYSASFYPWFATDPAKSLIGSYVDNSCIFGNGQTTNQRFHFDLNSGQVITRIYYENQHSVGADTNIGVQNFTFWGSNTEASFLELTYATDTGWTSLTIAESSFDEHATANQADPKYIVVTNSTSYQYYALKFADNYGGGNMGVRRIELQTGEADVEEANAILFGTNV